MARESVHDVYMTGLRNAHALETQALKIIDGQLGSLQAYPGLRQRLAAHRDETEAQRRQLDAILTRHNDSSSSIKDAALGLMGSMSSMAAAMAEDEVLKATFSNVAFENYEIAAYRSLIALAEQAGHAGDANELRRILREEEAMARWLAENVENVTRDYLARQGHSERVA